MDVLLFVAKHWHDILVVILLIASAITAINQWIKKNGPILQNMSVQEKIAYITRLLTNLTPIALVLVTDAEVQFGGGTGQLKRSYVIDELYKRIPDEYKKYITEDNLDSIINKALEQAEKLWTDNPNINKIVYGTQIPTFDIKEPETYIGGYTSASSSNAARGRV
jgi:hypothetical protein